MTAKSKVKATFKCYIYQQSHCIVSVTQMIKFQETSKWTVLLTCAKLRTGWSRGEVVDDADGEAVREGVSVNREESSSSADSLPAESEAIGERGWPSAARWCPALCGDADKLGWHACWPDINHTTSYVFLHKYNQLMYCYPFKIQFHEPFWIWTKYYIQYRWLSSTNTIIWQLMSFCTYFTARHLHAFF